MCFLLIPSRIRACPEAMFDQKQIISHGFNSNSAIVIIAMKDIDLYCHTLFAILRIYPQDKASQVSSQNMMDLNAPQIWIHRLNDKSNKMTFERQKKIGKKQNIFDQEYHWIN